MRSVIVATSPQVTPNNNQANFRLLLTGKMLKTSPQTL